jgi:tetratricopeptide (TPR) repeat protein
MYLKGSKWSMNRRRKRANPWRIIVLLVLIGGAVYVNQVIVPTTPPLFIPTPTPTRAPESFVTEAENYLAQGKMSLAMKSYEQAIAADPKNPANYVALARLQIYTNNYPDAITNTENALLLNTNNSMAQALRGWALGMQGEYLDAETSLAQALEIDPNNGVAYAYLSEVLANKIANDFGDLGTLDDAIAASRKAEELIPNSLEAHRARGVILELTGNYEEAVRELEAAVVLNDDIADLHLILGRNYRSLTFYIEAIAEFGRANALNPADPLPDTYIARTYATNGDYQKAIQYAEQAVGDAPEDPYMYGTLGQMYYKNGQYTDAVDALRYAIKGGTTEDGIVVEGLPLDYGRIAEYYSAFGLALAKTQQCGEALQISQLIQQGVANDEISLYNAEEIINICQESMS